MKLLEEELKKLKKFPFIENFKGVDETFQQIKESLNDVNFDTADIDVNRLFATFKVFKKAQGHLYNLMSALSCLMAKDFLFKEFGELRDCETKEPYNVLKKEQGASGHDILCETSDGKVIIGEIKNTVPAGKNDFGANQKKTIKEDLEKLNNSEARKKFFFVTDEKAFKYTQCLMQDDLYKEIELRLLPD